MLVDAFRPHSQATVTLTAGAAAVATAMPRGEVFEVQNAGTGVAYFEVGEAGVVADPASATPVLPGAARQFRRHQHRASSTISVIAPSGGGSVYVTGGTGTALRVRGRGGKGAAGPSGPVAIFDAPLTSSLVPRTAGDPTFTFTRATTAYVADCDGILRNAVANEARFQGARRVRNILVVSSEDFAGAWSIDATATVTAGQTDPLGGSTASKISNVNVNAGIYNGHGVNAPSCASSIWLKGAVGGEVVKIGDASVQVVLTTAWRRYGTLTPVAGYFIVRSQTANATIFVWHAQQELVDGASNTAPSEYVSVGVLAAPYYGAGVDGVKYFATTNGNSVAGNVVTEATGTAIPAATLLGYVAENQATNLCKQSQTFDDVAWTPASATITPNTQSAPDGTLTADTLTDAAANTQHKVTQTGIAVTNANYAASVYVKSGTLPWVQLLASALGNVCVNFNLATGAQGFNVNIVSASAVNVGNGWWRLSMTWLPTGSGGASFAILGLNADIATFNAGYNGTGTGTLYLWGAQVEQASDASSYIPTTSASVTRNTDVLNYPVASNLNLTVGSAYAEWKANAAFVGGGLPIVTDSLSVSYALYLNNALKPAIYDGTNVVAYGIATTLPSPAVQKSATAWGSSVLKAVSAGGAVASGSFDGTMDMTALGIGTGGTIRGTIRNVKIYATALTDAQMIAATA